MGISIDVGGLQPHITEDEFNVLKPLAEQSYRTLMDRTGLGNEFLGWLDLPSETSSSLEATLMQTARHLSQISELCIVTGIGGSYLGARAVIEALQHSFASLQPKRGIPFVIYAGHQMSADYMADLNDLLEHMDYSVIIISKSGTTTEPAVAFRMLKAHLEQKYGKDGAKQRIVAITDKDKGALKKLSDHEGYTQFIVPDDVGGRFSVLTPVGLLPIAVAGCNISELLQGARTMQAALCKQEDAMHNMALRYACARNACYRKGYFNEIMVNYEPRLFYLTEWWKQLYGESEGKDGKGIFPAGVGFTTDLHSMGQYIQDGERKLFETVLSVVEANRPISVPTDAEDADGLNFIAGKDLTEVNHMAALGTFLAHSDGGVPIIRLQMDKLDAFHLGQLIYFFEFACAISGYMLGVNPFDQPGVEAYKKNMFALLGKPGFETETAAIRKRIL